MKSISPSSAHALRCTAPMKASLPPPTMPYLSLAIGHLALLLKRRIERHAAGLKVQPLHKRARFLRPVLAIHPGVFPLDAQRPLVPHAIESPNERLPPDVSPPDTPEVPPPPRITEGQHRPQHTAQAIAALGPVMHRNVLHVHVEDPIPEPLDELVGRHTLPQQMAR